MNDDRLMDIEIKLTRQEDLLDTLNQTVWRQQQKIDELEAACAALARRLLDVQSSSQAASHEKPPHY